jgi:8-hydroxy-5-deazaflavin:NADPH oxidoreductase
MRVTVIGAGALGRALVGAWVRSGHDVTVGVRGGGPREGLGGAKVDTVDRALADVEVVVLALPAGAVPPLAAEHGRRLAGRVVVDPTVRLGGGPMNSRAHLDGLGVSYVRAFSTLADALIAAPPPRDGEAPDMFFAASDERGRRVAERLIEDVGLRAVYVGGDEAVDVVDGVTWLWFALGVRQGHGNRVGFRTVFPPPR